MFNKMIPTRCFLGCLLAVVGCWCAALPATAQELIAPGQPMVDQVDSPPKSPPSGAPRHNPFTRSDDTLPAPKTGISPQRSDLSMDRLPDAPAETSPKAPASVEPSSDPLAEYRRSLEEHILQKERAKLEARARFEARSRDRIPKLQPTQSLRPAVEQDAEEFPTPKKRDANSDESSIASPSDLKLEPARDDDLLPTPKLTPPTSEDRAKPKSEQDRKLDDLLAPRKPATPSRSPDRTLPEPLGATPRPVRGRPERLGGDTDPPIKAKPADDQAEQTDASDEDDREKNDASDDRQSSSRSVLSTPPLPARDYDHHWSGLVEDEMGRWPQPASFRPAGAISHVRCSTCGGCVDRSGNGFIDKHGVCLGVGTGERKACQCWRCPNGPPFNRYGPGGYVGPARSAPMHEYRLRNGDQVQLTFLIKTVRTTGAYRLVVGDELLVESEADEKLTRGTLERGLEIQPDGTITLRFIGQVHAAGQTIEQLRDLLNERYEEYYPDPSIDVTPVLTNNVARQIREAISGSEGFNPQQTLQRVTPEGTLRLPRLGAIPTQGLTLAELKREINLRYDAIGAGLEVEVVLEEQAPHYIYVVGEVATPGRFEIDAPTTVLGSIALAGSYVPGANLRQVVVFRRGPNWELLSTMLDLRGALLGKASRPSDEIWLQDGDVIIVPPAPIALFDRFVRQVFTEGIYGIVPFTGFGFTLGNDN